MFLLAVCADGLLHTRAIAQSSFVGGVGGVLAGAGGAMFPPRVLPGCSHQLRVGPTLSC